jgi:ketosteroid isomerase-like protein
MDLQQTIQQLSDRVQLWELMCRCAQASDERDYDTLDTMFTEDVRFTPSSGKTYLGRASTIDFMRASAAQDTLRTHMPTSQVIDVLDGDFARATAIVLVMRQAAEGGRAVSALRYRDGYRRDGGVWRFAERHIYQVVPLA